MPPLQRLAATRSRVFRRSEGPKTPEPSSEDGTPLQPPSPPRPRFRLRKRNASHLNAPPTQQFLASVAAADVPIPSIEEPLVVDENMVDTSDAFPIFHGGMNMDITPDRLHVRHFSLPKTPAPLGEAPSLSQKQYPDWSLDSTLEGLESSPEYESSRPSTARSTQTNGSLFSRFSLTSEAFSECPSPDKEHADRGTGLLGLDDPNRTVRAPAASARSRKAPWTQAMSKHLWSMYMMYLQDPKVTPVRIGKSGIPPHGVLLRVAREARRSWKGSQPCQSAAERSGSNTPTADAPSAFVQWPHTDAATRARLKEMCKANSRSATRNQQYFAHSPTPFGKSAQRSRNRRATPARSPSVFSSSDMAMSLAVCTSDSMHLQAPLTQLTQSQFQPAPEQTSSTEVETTSDPILAPPIASERTRLGSPFEAKSYGPSSSRSLAEAFEIGPELHRQSHTLGHWRSLRSPARLTRSRSNTQKRRTRQSVGEPRRSKRPGLASDLYSEPNLDPASSESNSVAPGQAGDLFVSRENTQHFFGSLRTSAAQTASLSLHLPITEAPARLGSPFSAQPTSFSFPNRFSSPSNLEMEDVRRPFASAQRPSVNGSKTTNSSLANRLAYIDDRLKHFRRRDEERRRTESPL